MLHLSKLKRKKRKLLQAVQFLNLSVFAYDDKCHGQTAEKSQFIRLHSSSAPFPKCGRSQTPLGNRCLSKFFGTKSPGLPSSFFTRRLGKQAPSQQNVIACEQSRPRRPIPRGEPTFVVISTPLHRVSPRRSDRRNGTKLEYFTKE